MTLAISSGSPSRPQVTLDGYRTTAEIARSIADGCRTIRMTPIVHGDICAFFGQLERRRATDVAARACDLIYIATVSSRV